MFLFTSQRLGQVQGFSADPIHAITATKAIAATTSGGIDVLGVYKAQLAAHPLVTKMMTGATLAVCGDAIAQRKASSEEYDVARASSFAVFDMAYRALQHYSFPILTTQLQGQFLGGISSVLLANFLSGPEALHAAASMEQTLGSQLIIVPFLYYPAFFSLTGAMQGLDGTASLKRAQENFLPLMKRNLLFWIPVQFVQFGFIPEDLQIPFLSCAGLAWTFILSVSAGSAKQYSAPSEANDQSNASPLIIPEDTTNGSIDVKNVPFANKTERGTITR